MCNYLTNFNKCGYIRIIKFSCEEDKECVVLLDKLIWYYLEKKLDHRYLILLLLNS